MNPPHLFHCASGSFSLQPARSPALSGLCTPLWRGTPVSMLSIFSIQARNHRRTQMCLPQACREIHIREWMNIRGIVAYPRRHAPAEPSTSAVSPIRPCWADKTLLVPSGFPVEIICGNRPTARSAAASSRLGRRSLHEVALPKQMKFDTQTGFTWLKTSRRWKREFLRPLFTRRRNRGAHGAGECDVVGTERKWRRLFQRLRVSHILPH